MRDQSSMRTGRVASQRPEHASPISEVQKYGVLMRLDVKRIYRRS